MPKNHLGEPTFSTFSGWRAAVKKAAGRFHVRFDGDKDICQAFALHPDGRRADLGQWDGAEGFISKGAAAALANRRKADRYRKQVPTGSAASFAEMVADSFLGWVSAAGELLRGDFR